MKKKRKKDKLSVKGVLNSPANEGVVEQDEIYIVSSGDEDCSKGVKSNSSIASVILHIQSCK